MKKREQLFIEAKQAMSNAYAPYSHYRVGAAILSENDNIYKACNVENVSFPCGTCAEAGAIATMITNGEHKIKEILIVSEGKSLVYPCGSCLQRIAEFSDENTKINLADIEKICKTYTLSELLPHCFKEEI